MTYSIETITTLIGAHRIGEAEGHIDWLLTDSRSLTFPEESLFFAIRTQKNDGHRYIGELYRRGVRNFVVSQVPEAPEADANYLKVPSPLKALQRSPLSASPAATARPSSRSGSTSYSRPTSTSPAHRAHGTHKSACHSASGDSPSRHKSASSRRVSANPARCRHWRASSSPP